MRRLLSGCLLLLLVPLALRAAEQDPNHCHEPSVWPDWEERTAKHPDDLELQTLPALWMGLCRKVERGDIELAHATGIFERAREALIQQRREQRKDHQPPPL